MRMLDDPSYIAPLREIAVEGRQGWTAWSFSRVLDTLARLARDEEDKTAVREVLVSYVDHPSQRIRAGALSALGTLGDAKAIPIVQAFARDEAGDRVARAARSALDRLEQEKKLVPQEVVELRKAVRELKDDNEKLRDELEEIKKRLDAEETREPADEDAAPGD
jgi:HEAT repeat protein